MKFVSSLQMKEIDRKATEKYGIPSLVLMENAGRGIADEAQIMIKDKTGKIIVFCGYGNNGGDGFVAARHLANRGYCVEVYLAGRNKTMSSDAEINFRILENIKVKINKIKAQSQINRISFNKAKLIIDAIFGIGVKGELDIFYQCLIEKINESKIPVLAVDVPSGLDADSGVALPVAIKARRTLAMGLMKKYFLNPSARKFTGKVAVVDISLPRQLK